MSRWPVLGQHAPVSRVGDKGIAGHGRGVLDHSVDVPALRGGSGDSDRGAGGDGSRRREEAVRR